MMESVSNVINLAILLDFAHKRKKIQNLQFTKGTNIVLVKNLVRGRLIKRKIVSQLEVGLGEKNKGKKGPGIGVCTTALILLSAHPALAVKIAIVPILQKRKEKETREANSEKTKRESIENSPTKRRNITSVWNEAVVVAVARVPLLLHQLP